MVSPSAGTQHSQRLCPPRDMGHPAARPRAEWGWHSPAALLASAFLMVPERSGLSPSAESSTSPLTDLQSADLASESVHPRISSTVEGSALAPWHPLPCALMVLWSVFSSALGLGHALKGPWLSFSRAVHHPAHRACLGELVSFWSREEEGCYGNVTCYY